LELDWVGSAGGEAVRGAANWAMRRASGLGVDRWRWIDDSALYFVLELAMEKTGPSEHVCALAVL
jgi:hypothetical protein